MENESYKAIYWEAAEGITAGYEGGKYFGPKQTTLRSEFATFIYRVAGKPDVSGKMPFPDVKNASTSAIYKGILWCSQKGIVKGYNEKGKTIYKPSNTITRQEAMIMVYRYARDIMKLDVSISGTTLPYSDVTGVKNTSDIFKALMWGYEKGIDTGVAPNKYDPSTGCTRETLAIMLYRMIQLGK